GELPDGVAMQCLAGDPLDDAARRDELGIAAHEQWNPGGLAGPHRLPVRLEVPAAEQEGVKRAALQNRDDLRSVAAAEPAHVGPSRHVGQETTVIAAEQVGVPLKLHTEIGASLLLRALPMREEDAEI